MNAPAATDLVFISASPMPLGRIFRAYFTAARYELVQTLRAPVFTFPFLVLPVAIYLLFGVVFAGQSPELAANPQIATYLLSGFCAFAVMGPGMFGFGIGLAMERDQGLLKLKRALPLPAGAHLLAKMAMSMACAGLAAGTVVIVALVAGNVIIGVGSLLTLLVVMIAGSLPFCAIGLLIGAYSSSGAAPAIVNVVYLPGIWLSGIFFPLPEALQPWAIIWPVFHLNQTALGFAGVKGFIDPLWAAAVLLGITVLCTGIAVRRLTRVG
jgi:ABC-2 type transport system permease protein